MKPYIGYGNYDLHPSVPIKTQNKAYVGWDDIRKIIRARMKDGARTVVVDFYPGVDKTEVEQNLKLLPAGHFVDAEECALPEEELNTKLYPYLTDDRTFGFVCRWEPDFLFDRDRLKEKAEEVSSYSGTQIIYGVGASFLTTGDLYIYCDMPRREIELRYHGGMSNWHAHNSDLDYSKRYKRGYFVEWHLADQNKIRHLHEIDYLIDTVRPNDPRMISGDTLFDALRQTAGQPFRVEPYFDKGVWGGNWMMHAFKLPPAVNYAWCFDCVPEENTLNLDINDTIVSIPCNDLIYAEPHRLLGEKVHGRFGLEFPIRFDYLDTIGGGNLSLQVHPLTEYIQETFGMNYTQDESYYIMQATDESCVYLGVKNGTKPEEMGKALLDAQENGATFDAEKFVNRIPAKKHDHFLIPGGTIHCSGAGTLVLEISSTPNIFTFKMWDWGRLDLNGKPRPIYIDHAMKNIQFDRNTDWIHEHAVNHVTVEHEEPGETVEITGLHEREFIKTTRYWLTKPAAVAIDDSVNVINLAEGKEALVESTDDSFKPFTIHYGETAIIPAAVGTYRLAPTNANKIGVIVASVR